MNKIRQSIPWWQFLITFMVFFVVVGIAYLYRQKIIEIILIPILYSIWVVKLALRIFGQQCIWTLALMIALVLSYIFFQRSEKPIKSSHRTVYGRGPAVGRIQFWQRRVSLNSDTVYAVGYRHLAMRQLIIQALAYRENSNNQEIENKLRSGQLSVPAEVGNILGLDNQSKELQNSFNLVEFIKLRLDWITERFRTPKYVSDSQIEKVAEYLENLMEVDNDARNH